MEPPLYDGRHDGHEPDAVPAAELIARLRAEGCRTLDPSEFPTDVIPAVRTDDARPQSPS